MEMKVKNESYELMKKYFYDSTFEEAKKFVLGFISNADIEEPVITDYKTALQELEVALGLRQKQQSEFDGTLDEAKVLSIDSESGLIVINAGSKGGVKVDSNGKEYLVAEVDATAKTCIIKL